MLIMIRLVLYYSIHLQHVGWRGEGHVGGHYGDKGDVVDKEGEEGHLGQPPLVFDES